MRCFKCDAVLTKEGHCPACGVDVSMYKKAVMASNAYYNLGLSKARIRDLSGAVESLKMSILINKKNIDARNLLGLVYCEMGDVVEALSEWVISKNIQPDGNVASDYITDIQSNQNRFEMITTTVKKYNLSLRYAKDGNYDMATIQLKKVVSQNPRLLKAQQLLALLYIKDKEYSRARKHLNAVLKIDRNNTLALLYLQEIDEELQSRKKDSQQAHLKKKNREDERRPLSGNDVIMPRSSYKEPSNGAITVINILVGVVIGAALIWFLIIPSRYRGLTAEYNKSIQEYSEQLSSGNVELNSLQSQLDSVKEEKAALEERLAEVSGTDGNNKLLSAVITAANLYISNDNTAAAEAIADVDVSSLPLEEAKTLYNTISGATMTAAANDLYSRGMNAYYSADYTSAADYLVRSYKCDKTRADAVYYAARCYVSLNQTENAKNYYQIIVDEFKTSGYLSEAENYVNSH
jgi:Tfp pilus assembly protein PilF